jgi:RecJ-like exonuclease
MANDVGRTLILTHADIDGMCAGAIALSRFPEARVFFTKPVSLHKDLDEAQAERIIIADIAIAKSGAQDLVSLLKRKRAEITYFDHHPIPDSTSLDELRRSAKKFVWGQGMCASELVYDYYKAELPAERAWLALYGAIGDFTEEGKFAQAIMQNWDKHSIYFEVCSMIMAIKMKRFEGYDAKRGVVGALSRGKNPSSIGGLVEAARESVSRELDLYHLVKEQAMLIGRIGYMRDLPSFGFRGPAALFSATVTSSPVGMYIHRRKNIVDVTIRRRDASLELNRLAEYAGERVGGSGGGHPEAAGCRIPMGAENAFLEAANEWLKKNAG